MVSWDDVAAIALALPETSESESRGQRHWVAPGKRKTGFVWERPLHKSDEKALKALGQRIPDGPIAAVSVEHLGAKEALLASAGGAGIFTIPHFDDYPAVLVELDVVDRDTLEELIVESWLARAPEPLVRAYLDAQE